MKKLAVSLACALCAAMVLAGDFYPFKITVAAGGTSGTRELNLYKVGGGYTLSEVDKIAYGTTDGIVTGVVSVVPFDFGLQGTALVSADLAATNTLYTVYPTRTVVTPGWVGYATSTGAVLLVGTTSTALSNAVPYYVRRVKVTLTQPASAVPTVFEGGVYVK